MKKLIFSLLMLLTLLSICSASSASLQPDEDLSIVLDEPLRMSKTFSYAEKIYSSGKIKEAYAIWLDEAFKGDLYALAQLCITIQNNPGVNWPVSASFFENWLVQMLGEAEACFWIGFLYTFEINFVPSNMDAKYYMRSALAGHFEGTYAVAFTFDDDLPYTPPPGSPEVTVIPKKYTAKYTEGQRYWMSRAADAGHPKAAAFLGSLYKKIESPQEGNQELAEKYLDIAIANGFFPAAAWLGIAYQDYFPSGLKQKENYFNTALYLIYEQGYITDRNIDLMIDFTKNSPRLKEPLMPRSEVVAEVERAKKAYAEIKARVKARKDAREALFAKARLRLPEVKAEYEKLAAQSKK